MIAVISVYIFIHIYFSLSLKALSPAASVGNIYLFQETFRRQTDFLPLHRPPSSTSPYTFLWRKDQYWQHPNILFSCNILFSFNIFSCNIFSCNIRNQNIFAEPGQIATEWGSNLKQVICYSSLGKKFPNNPVFFSEGVPKDTHLLNSNISVTSYYRYHRCQWCEEK